MATILSPICIEAQRFLVPKHIRFKNTVITCNPSVNSQLTNKTIKNGTNNVKDITFLFV